MVGQHCLGQWSRMQATVALSSAEAELNACVKAVGEGLFLSRIFQFFKVQVSLEVLIDASAAKDIMSRQGVGKLKHLAAKQLWVQQFTQHLGPVCLRKIVRSNNLADFFTHAVPQESLETKMVEMGATAVLPKRSPAEGGS